MTLKKTCLFIFLFCISITLWSFTIEDNVEEHFRYGYELFNAGRFEEAEIEFRNLLLIQPELALGYLWLGKVLTKKELGTEALQVWTKGLEMEPGHKELRKLLGKKIVESVVNNNKIKKKSAIELIGKKEHAYKVKEGDTLQSIAIRIFGNKTMSAKIAVYNKIDSLKNIGVGGEIRIPVTEAELIRLSQSEKMEQKYVENQNQGKMLASVSKSINSKTNENPQNSVNINEMEPNLDNPSKNTSGGATDSNPEIPISSSENPIKAKEPITVVEDFDPEKEEEYKKICEEYRDKIDDGLLDYNLDHSIEMDKNNFNLETLKKEGYIDKYYICPVPDSKYEMNENGDIKCSYHNEE